MTKFVTACAVFAGIAHALKLTSLALNERPEDYPNLHNFETPEGQLTMRDFDMVAEHYQKYEEVLWVHRPQAFQISWNPDIWFGSEDEFTSSRFNQRTLPANLKEGERLHKIDVWFREYGVVVFEGEFSETMKTIYGPLTMDPTFESMIKNTEVSEAVYKDAAITMNYVAHTIGVLVGTLHRQTQFFNTGIYTDFKYPSDLPAELVDNWPTDSEKQVAEIKVLDYYLWTCGQQIDRFLCSYPEIYGASACRNGPYPEVDDGPSPKHISSNLPPWVALGKLNKE